MNTKRHMKGVLLFLMAFVAIMGVATSVHAQAFSIDKVKVNDLELGSNSSTVLDVERGQVLDIEVFITGLLNGTDSVDNVVVTGRIMGYEFGSVLDSEGPFSIDGSNTYKKTLTLVIPDDIDASQGYTLRIDVSDKNDEITEEVALHIDEQRHDLSIFDVLLNPSSTIAAGNPLFVTVRLENLGEKKEDDVKVKVSIPDLGVSTVSYLNKLNTEIQEKDTDNHFDQQNSGQLDMLLKIPSDAPSGTYEVRVDVEYNRGHSFLTESLDLNVVGVKEDTGVQTVLNSDSTSKATTAGETVQYKVMLANIGTEPGVYSVQIDGVSTWGEASVQPSFITVMPDSTGEVTISVTPYDAEESASHTWVARITLGSEVLNEMVFTTKVNSLEATQPEKTSDNDTLKSVLAVIFGVLVIVLVVLALVIAFRKASGDEDGEEGSSLEGQTYYQYYPKR